MSKEKMPVPVAGVGDTYTLLWAGSETISAIHERSGVKVGSLLVTIEQAEAYAAAKVREALEEAAEIADRNNDFATFDAIRALIPSQTGDSE